MPLICEGLVTTRNKDGSTNVSPMGPTVDRNFTTLSLRPFYTSHTFQNLVEHRFGVFHVTDDVELLAQAAINRVTDPPSLEPMQGYDAHILTDCCRWFAFEVVRIGEDGDRRDVVCRIVDQGTRRDFFGFNRAMYAVVEAAILATRVHLIPHDQLAENLDQLKVLINKTAGEKEERAFELLRSYIGEAMDRGQATP